MRNIKMLSGIAMMAIVLASINSCCGGSNEAQIRNSPYALSATDGVHAGRIVLTWQYDGDYDFFEVWRKAPEGEWEAYAQAEGTSFEDTEVDNGAEYHYQVRASLNNTYSQHSTVDKGTSSDRMFLLTALLNTVTATTGTGHCFYTNYEVLDGYYDGEIITDQYTYDLSEPGHGYFTGSQGINIIIPTAASVSWFPEYQLLYVVDEQETDPSYVFEGTVDNSNINLTILALEVESYGGHYSVLDNVQLAISPTSGENITVATETNGIAKASLVNGMDYTVTPSLAGRSFTPSSVTVTALDAGESTAITVLSVY